MKKLILACALAISVAGCAQLQTAESLLTTGIANPITKDTLYNIENAMTIAMAGLQTYKKACAAGAADKNCKGNIAVVQNYTRQLPKLLAQLRTFVKNNDQVNAQTVYNTVVSMVNQIKAIAVANNIQVGG